MIHCVFFPVACGLSDDEAYINCVIVYIAYTHTDMRMKNDLKTFDEGRTNFRICSGVTYDGHHGL